MKEKKAGLKDAPDGVENRLKARSSRRDFFKKVLVSTVAVTATAGAARKVADLLPDASASEKYLKDLHAGDGELLRRQYVLMTKKEKEELIRLFNDNSKA